jgi:hypothetical protein
MSDLTITGQDLVAKVEAERAIHRTFFRFFRLMDTLEWERAGAETFTAGAVLDNRALPEGSTLWLEGRDAICGALAAGRSGMQMVAHVAGQILIEWDGGRPRLTAYVTAWHWFADNASEGDLRPADWVVVSLVEDEFELADGEWLVSHRTVSPVAGIVAAGAVAS